MRVHVALAASLFSAACSTQVPGNVPGYDRVLYLGEHDPRDIGIAIHVWRASLSWWTGDLADVSKLTIEERDLGDEMNGAHKPGHIVIEPGPLPLSALTHELTHAHLLATDGTEDRDHADGDGPWTAIHDAAIEDAGEEMRRLGL